MSKGKGKTVFAREATGLVREIGWFTAIAMVMSAVIGAGINGFAVQAYGYSPVGNSVSPLAMVLFVAIPFFASAVCLGIMSSAMPRSGGPYVVISRSTKPILGFLSSWGSWVSIAFSVGLLAQYDIYFWGTSFTVWGAIAHDAGATALGGVLTAYPPDPNTWVSVILGIVLVLIITGLAALGVNIFGRVIQLLFVIPVIGSLLTMGVLLTHTAADLPTYWNAVFGAGSYTAINASALPYTPDFVASFAALPGVIFAFTAFYASSYVGGEVKNPKRNMVTSLVLGMALIILFFVVYTGGLANAVGEPFLYAYAVAGASATGAPAILPLFAAVYSYTIPVLAIFITITGALWLLNDLPPFFLIATRSTFAWAFDRQFPEKFADVSERFHSPTWSVLLCGILAIPAVFASGMTIFGSLFYITFIDCFTYLFICISALFFIKKFKSAYEKGAKLGGPAVLYLAGIIGTVFWILLLGMQVYLLNVVDIYYIDNPLLVEGLLVIITFLVGALIYFYYRSKNKKMGIDVSKIYGEIPPE
jgi:APA family basic amino acid/polyamine antiporter